MSRIRSVHPGLFTDEAFVALSMPARVFLIGVWTVADDRGVFEWKPISLKMQLFPNDNIDPAAMLEELAAADLVRKVEHDKKTYGAVRNFCKWQRTKNPAYKHPFPEEWREYTKFTGASSPSAPPALPQESLTATGNRPQREEGGGKMDGKEEGVEDKNRIGVVTRGRLSPTKKSTDIPTAAALLAGPLWKQFSDAYPGPIGKAAERTFKALVEAGENADQIVAAALRANPAMPAQQWLEQRAWTQPSLRATDAPKQHISPEATSLGNEIALIAGQDLEFIEPGWCGAAWRCQQWLNNGWPGELIVAGVQAMVTAKAPEKISSHAYFDKGLARFIAQQTRPVPKVIEYQAETVEVKRAEVGRDSRSGVGAISEVYNQLRTAAEVQPGGGGEVPDTPVRRLPA